MVITHGTDTLEDLAFFLNLTLKSSKPVILTGAMRPADDEAPDGPSNLINAVRIAVDEASSGQGVLVALNEEIFAARDLVKGHNRQSGAFTLNHIGCIGYVDPKGVRLQYQSTMPHTLSTESDVSDRAVLPRVAVLSDYVGFDAGPEEGSVDPDIKGVVVRSFAGGRCSNGMND
jgi:L-asparaginase